MISGKLVKTFKVSKSGKLCVAAFYEEDMMFYSNDETIHKIVLLDDSGQPTISKKGKLLTDPQANHQETTFLRSAGNNIRGLVIDTVRRKLVFCDYENIYEINFNNSGFRKLVVGNGGDSLAIFGNQLYFSDSTRIFRTTITSTNTTISCNLQKGSSCQKIFSNGKDYVKSMMVEKYNKKLYFRLGNNVIAVVDINLPNSAYPVQTPRVVISDTRYTYGFGGIAVHGNRLIWNRVSASFNQRFLGLMNKDLNFVSKKHIYKFENQRKKVHNPAAQLDVFEHLFSTNPRPTNKGQFQFELTGVLVLVFWICNYSSFAKYLKCGIHWISLFFGTNLRNLAHFTFRET